MKIEMDLEKLKALAAEKKEENYGFRSFLKSCGIASSRIDSMVQRLYKKISAQVDCRQCGNCCKEPNVVLNISDVEALAKALKMKKEEVIAAYLVKKVVEQDADAEEEIEEEYLFNVRPCPFFVGEENRCKLYRRRPHDCRSFPHLQKKQFKSRTISVIQGCSVCPVIYSVYEELKEEVWAMVDEVDVDDDF